MAGEPNEVVAVRSVPVLRGWERVAFVALTALAIAATVAFGWYWVRLRESGAGLVAYLLTSAVLLFLAASWFARWLILWQMRRPVHLAPDPRVRVAVVTTFVPWAEPLGMLEQSVSAMVAMTGPHDTWVLDEGNQPDVQAFCQRLGVRYFSRAGRSELATDEGPLARATKYGNYNAWLTAVGYQAYDIVVSFDPDHIPERRFLARVLGYFRDPKVAYVQAPQVYYNQRVSLVARGGAEETYAYYSAHQMASYGIGQPILVGSHSAQRIEALAQVGGFAAHDADDLLITMRYRALGWKGVYVPELLAMGLTPVGWTSYLQQQIRWSRSVIDLKIRELPKIFGRLPPVERWADLLHGMFYLRSVVAPLIYLTVILVVLAAKTPVFLNGPAVLRLALFATTLGAVSRFRYRYFLDRAREGAVPWRSLLMQFVKWPYQLVAVWQGLLRPASHYVVTVKVPRDRRRRPILWPHWGVAVVLLGVWAAALAKGAPVWGARSVTVLVLAIVSAMAGGLGLGTDPSPWEPNVYDEWRTELRDVLGSESSPNDP